MRPVGRLVPFLMLALVASSTVEAKPCIPIKQVPRVLTPKGATIASGGGIVVAYRNLDQADDKNWRVRAGSQLISPGIKTIAPGLDIYDVGPATGDFVLEDSDQTELLEVHRGKLAAIAAPKIKRVWTNNRGPRRGSAYAFVVAELDAKPPEGALALVLYGNDGVARSWGLVTSGVLSVTVYTSGGCGSASGGAVPSSQSDSVRLAWVDSAGRISKLSAAITVAMR